MARSSVKTASESDVTAAAVETLDFDDVTLRGTFSSMLIIAGKPPGFAADYLRLRS